MNEKKNRLFRVVIMLFALFFTFPIKSYASNLCTENKALNLKREASKINVSWELKFDEQNHYYFEVTVANMGDSLLLKYGDNIYDGAEVKGPFVIKKMFEGGKTYELNFYGGYNTSCVEEYIYTKKIKIPKYNIYSELEECIEYEEFPLCHRYYEGDIDSIDYFNTKLDEYKEYLESQKKPKEEVVSKSIIEKIIDFYLTNIYITLPITIIVVLAILVLILRKIIISRRRTKIDI